ncbi:hypothetical protein BU15DRAFT_51528 [Melanogaster broomeanus]|nr:hypothetical protein BU15DRAFT_51528 [Melanogaster broomeanus]
MSSDGENPAVSAEPNQTGHTPIAKKGTHAHLDANPPPSQNVMNLLLAEETKGRYVGPLPVQDFFKNYMPCDQEVYTGLDLEQLSKVATPGQREQDMYEPFIASIKGCLTNMTVVDTSKHSAQIGPFELKPDLCLYKTADITSAVTDFSTMEMWIEFKANNAWEPFEDPQGGISGKQLKEHFAQYPFEKDTTNGKQTRGQITSYALAQIGSQFRRFAFSLVIVKDRARFIRWDRAGAIVSTQFKYKEEPQVLAEFFCRFSRLSPVKRGHDESVRPAADLLQDVEREIRGELGLDADTPLFAYDVPVDENKKKTLTFYGPRPPCPPRSLIGRSTRTLPVCEMSGISKEKLCVHRVVYLKDTWRVDAKEMQPESDVYRKLEEAKVPNIAPFICGGDFKGCGAKTETNQLATEERWGGVWGDLTAHALHRLILGVVGRGLVFFKCTKELAQSVLDSMRAHWHAYNDAQILHRDVSAGNIIITNSGQGLLIDWDLSKPLSVTTKRRRDRTGTWQFMSAALLRNIFAQHKLEDDNESFLHVLAWSTIRYVPSTLSSDACAAHLREVYDSSSTILGTIVGGNAKADKFGANTYIPKFELSKPSPILDLLKQLVSPFSARYMDSPSYEEREIYEGIKLAVSTMNLTVGTGAYETHRVHQYDLAMERLASSKWFINTMEESLARDDWPAADKAEHNLLTPTDGTLKQQRLSSFLMANQSSRMSSSTYPTPSSHSSKRAHSPSPVVEPRTKRLRGDAPSGSGTL